MGPVALVVAGASLGEAALARPVADAIRAQGGRCLVLVDRERNARLFAGHAVEVVQGARQLLRRLEAARPRAVTVSTSYTCGPLLPSLRRLEIWLTSLEITWLPWAEAEPAFWSVIDRFFIALPASAGERGLREEGGPFSLAPQLRARMEFVGFPHQPIPAAPASTQQVFLYPGSDPQDFLRSIPDLPAALEALRRLCPAVRVCLCAPKPVPTPGWVEVHQSLSPADFQRHLAESRLVICHHGALTISQAAVQGIPISAVSPGEALTAHARMPWADREMHAFARSDVLDPIYGCLPPDTLARRWAAQLAAGPGQAFPGGGAAVIARSLLRGGIA